MARLRIVVNFKNTPEDIDLYNKLKKRSSMSGYIKDVLKGLEDGEVIDENKDTYNKKDNDISDEIVDILN